MLLRRGAAAYPAVPARPAQPGRVQGLASRELGSNGLGGGGGAAAVTNAGAGGNGGKGGASGLSGHGAPGPSIALATQGAKPVLETTELAPGAGGAGQPALSKDGNAGVKVLQAVTGDSLPRYDF